MKKYVLLTTCIILLCLLLTTTNTECKTWKNDNAYHKPVAMTSDYVLFKSHDGVKYALIICKDASTGNLVWEKKLECSFYSLDTIDVLVDGNIYIIKRALTIYKHDQDSIIQDEVMIVCVDYVSGKDKWSVTANELCPDSKYFYIIDSFSTTKEYLYLLDKSRILKISKETGNVTELGEITTKYPSSSISMIDDTKCILEGYVTYCLNIEDSFKIIWDTEDNWIPYGSEAPNMNEYGMHNDEILILYGYDKETKRELPNLYKSLLAIDINDGTILWRIKPTYDFILIDDVLIVGYDDALRPEFTMKVYDISDGTILWSRVYDASTNKIFLFEEKKDMFMFGINYGGHDEIQRIDPVSGDIVWEVTDLYIDKHPVLYSNCRIFYDNYCKPFSCCEEKSVAMLKISFKIDRKSYIISGQEIDTDVTPIIQNGRTLLPARYVTEPFGGQVFWDGEKRKVTCKLVAPDNAETEDYKENIVELWIGKSTARLNGIEVQIDPNNPKIVPTIINDRTMVPMRFLAESLGCEVEWIADTKEIILTYTP